VAQQGPRGGLRFTFSCCSTWAHNAPKTQLSFTVLLHAHFADPSSSQLLHNQEGKRAPWLQLCQLCPFSLSSSSCGAGASRPFPADPLQPTLSRPALQSRVVPASGFGAHSSGFGAHSSRFAAHSSRISSASFSCRQSGLREYGKPGSEYGKPGFVNMSSQASETKAAS